MFYRFIKRSFDIFASVLGLLLTLPVWLIAIIGIEISDPGPVFYMANRIGKDNKLFRMFKFRSMRVAVSANEKSFTADQNRIFAFGKFIRAVKIDELPQLLNIIAGHMSIVGPRPAAKDQLDIVRAGKFGVTANTLPGLTGPGAIYDYIYGDTVTDEDEYRVKVLPTRLELEVYYIEHMSALYDIRMIWYTVVCVLCSLFHRKPTKIIRNLMGSIGKDSTALEELLNSSK